MTFLRILLGLGLLLMLVATFQAAPSDPHIGSALVNPPQRSDPLREAVAHIDLKHYGWSKSGFGSVMLLKQFSLANGSKLPAQDFKIECDVYAASGTRLGSAASTLYDAILPGKTRTFSELNMGFIHSQAAKAACRLIGVTVDGERRIKL